MQFFLGTVQFRMDYGLFYQKKPSLSESLACIDYAIGSGITAIDTATAYLPNILDGINPKYYENVIWGNLQNSLKTLHTEYIDAYLLHSAISHLVIGIRNLQQLIKDNQIFNRDIDESIFEYIDREFSEVDADIVIPSL